MAPSVFVFKRIAFAFSSILIPVADILENFGGAQNDQSYRIRGAQLIFGGAQNWTLKYLKEIALL